MAKRMADFNNCLLSCVLFLFFLCFKQMLIHPMTPLLKGDAKGGLDASWRGGGRRVLERLHMYGTKQELQQELQQELHKCDFHNSVG